MKLTDEQIEAAAKEAFRTNVMPRDYSRYGWNDLDEMERKAYRDEVIAAAPFLQFPWEMPTEEEVEVADRHINHAFQARNADGQAIAYCFGPSSTLARFVWTRNKALLPKPVDPRREKIACLIEKIKEESRIGPIDQVPPTPSEIAIRILAALDAKE